MYTAADWEVELAKACSKSDIAFFLPLIRKPSPGNFGLKPLWARYLFARVTEQQEQQLRSNRRVVRLLIPPSEEDLLEYLRLFAPISKTAERYLPGEEVAITAGPFTGYIGTVVGGTRISGEVTVRLKGPLVRFEIVRKIAEIAPVSGKRPYIDVKPDTTFTLDPPLPDPIKEPETETAVVHVLDMINAEVVRHLHNKPELMYDMDPRRFEQLIAHLMEDMGYEIELTPETHDGGRDILAVLKVPAGEILTIVECKRYRADRRVGIDIVERFLYTIDRKDNASCGLIATTSFFSEDALEREREHKWRLALKDFNSIKQWLANYGKWHLDSTSGIWVPKREPIKLIVPS